MLEAYFHTKFFIIALLFTAAVLVCTHFPQDTMPAPLQKGGIDNVEHVLAYGVITFLFLISVRTSLTMLSALLIFLAISVIGIFDELTQLLVDRTASVSDLVADIVGILIVLSFFSVRRRFLSPNPWQWVGV